MSKNFLDVAYRGDEAAERFENTPLGLEALKAKLLSFEVERVVFEATGGYERELAATLGAAGVSLTVINPRQARDFAKAIGKTAKTDKIDAAVLAHFAEALKPEPTGAQRPRS